MSPANAPVQNPGNAPQGAVVPFTNAAHEHTEPFFDQTLVPGTSVQNIGPVSVPSYGYLRHIFITVTLSGGVVGSATYSGDYPYNIFQSLSLVDTNGAPIFGPLDGYATLWSNIMGGYAYQMDPRRYPGYTAGFNMTFVLRIPIEISHHDGLGCLANQNSAANYQIFAALNTTAAIYGTLPTTAPNVRIQMALEAWSLPNEVDRAGRPQAQLPPAHGTTQYFSNRITPISVGANTSQFTRTGNLIRGLVIIARNAANVRAAGVFPDPAILAWDSRQLLQDTQVYRNQIAFERSNNLLALDTGVFLYHFNHSNQNFAGDDNPSLWLPTVQATRLELQGNSTVAGTLQIITNDIAPGEVIPAERYVETSATGFHPQVGTTNPAVQ